MIGYLSGKIIESFGDHVLLDVNGVGYKILVPVSLAVSAEKGDAYAFFVHTHVREDQLTLYGFRESLELFVFEKLISVSGIGPKSALSMLSLSSPSSIASCIEQGDAEQLSRTPGVGKKTAEKIILELRGKLTHLITTEYSKEEDEVRLALEALGYGTKEINAVIKKIDIEKKTTSTIIREALNLLH
jgi:holliday junction DNA helicase RuvA